MVDQNYYFVNSDQHALVTWCQEKGHHPQYQGHLTRSPYDIDPVGIYKRLWLVHGVSNPLEVLDFRNLVT